MKLQNVFTQYPLTSQVVLKFSNNNDRLIVPSDMDVNSKFIRSSKRRLGEDFVFDGIIQGDVVVHGTNAQLGNETCDGHVYRTHVKDKCDYFLFVITNEKYVLLENLRKKSYSSLRTNSNRQLTLNSITKPNADREMSICGGYDDGFYYFSATSPLFKDNATYQSMAVEYHTNHEYIGQYLGVCFGLKTALVHADKLDKVKVYSDKSLRYADGVYKLPLGNWRPFNQECQSYIDTITALKEELAKKGVSICFMK